MRSGKRQMTEKIELLNQEKIRTLREKENFMYVRMLEMDTIKQAEMKEEKSLHDGKTTVIQMNFFELHKTAP